MSDWEDENGVAIDKVPMKQPPLQRNWTRIGENVCFGMRSARHERTVEHKARELGKGDRGRVFQRNRVSVDETRGRARPLVFNVEKPSAGRIIGKLQLL